MNKRKDYEKLEDENKDKTYYIREKNLIRERARIEKERKIRERNKKKGIFLKNLKRRIKKLPSKTLTISVNFLKKCFDPQVIIGGVTAVLLYREINRVTDEIENQRQINAEIIRTIEADRNVSFVRRIWRDHKGKIIVTGIGIIGVPVVNHLARTSSLERELVKTQDNLSETESNLNQAKVDLKKAEGELIKTQQKKQELEKKSLERLNELEKESIVKLAKMEAEHQAHIKKLHVTLNRLNNAVLQSARKETESREAINRYQKELEITKGERDALEEQIEKLSQETEKKEMLYQQALIDLEIMEGSLKEKKREQVELGVSLKKAQEENSFFNLEARKLKKELDRADKNRKELQSDILRTQNELKNLKSSKKSTESNLESSTKQYENLKTRFEELKKNYEKTNVLLQKSIDETNREALIIDKVENELRESNIRAAKELKDHQIRSEKAIKEAQLKARKELEEEKMKSTKIVRDLEMRSKNLDDQLNRLKDEKTVDKKKMEELKNEKLKAEEEMKEAELRLSKKLKDYELETEKKVKDLEKLKVKAGKAIQTSKENAEKAIRDFQRTKVNDELKMQELRDKILIQQELINKTNQENEMLESELHKTEEKISQQSMTKEELKNKVKKLEEQSKKSSAASRRRIRELIYKNRKLVRLTDQEMSKLKQEKQQLNEQVVDNYVKNEELMENIRNLQKGAEEAETNFAALLRERDEQERLFNAAKTESEKVLNDVLDHQEQERKKNSWRSLLPRRTDVGIGFEKEFNLRKLFRNNSSTGNKSSKISQQESQDSQKDQTTQPSQNNEDKKAPSPERIHYFYPSPWLEEHVFPQNLKERYSETTGEWEFVRPDTE